MDYPQGNSELQANFLDTRRLSREITKRLENRYRPPPSPANDNVPVRDSVPRPMLDQIPKSSAFDRLAEGLGYLSPWGGLLSSIMGLYGLYDLLTKQDNPVNQSWAPNGYTLCPNEGGCAPPWGYTTLGAGACGPTLPNRCGNRSGALTKLPIIGTPSRIIVYGYPPGTVPGSGVNFRPAAVWNKGAASPTAAPRFVTDWPVEVPDLGDYPEPDYDIPEEYLPGSDPFLDPIKKTKVDADPTPWEVVPYRQDNDFRSPVEQPWRGPLAPLRIRTDPRIFPRTRPDTRTDDKHDTKTEPKVDVRVEPRIDPRLPPVITITTGGPPSPKRPPGKRTRERKYRAALPHVVKGLVNTITEGRDFIEAVWKGLPKELRSKPGKGRRKVSVQQMLKDLYDNWLDLDLPRAVKEILANELQDRFYGKVSQTVSKGISNAADQGYWTRPVGAQTGDRYRPQIPGKFRDKSDPVGDFFDRNLPHYSPRELLTAVGWI